MYIEIKLQMILLLYYVSQIKINKKKLATCYLRFTLFSPLKSLTTVFGMGTGVSSLLSSPIKLLEK